MPFRSVEPLPLPYDEVCERYEQSDRYLSDALDWFSDHVELAPEVAMGHYRESSAFVTMVDDIADGIVEL